MGAKLLEFIQWAWGWWKGGAVALALSVALAVLVYLVTGRNGDLIAWPSERTKIYPSPQTKDLSLPLSLSQPAVKSLVFVSMQISNAGKAPIGTQEQPWILRIAGPPEAKLVLVGEPHRSSRRLVVSPEDSAAANTVAVRVGSLEPREFFDVRFIVANASDVSNPSFQVSTSLRGLPDPILTHSSPAERAAQKLAPWFWALCFAILMYEAIVDRYHPESGPQMLQGVKDWRLRLAGRAMLGVFLSGAASIFLAIGIGWIAVTLWRLGFAS